MKQAELWDAVGGAAVETRYAGIVERMAAIVTQHRLFKYPIQYEFNPF